MKLLSIVTVTRDNSAELKKTLESVSSCINDYCEHLIIDGASTDDTNLIVNSGWQHHIRFYSEPDNGIYDAMNKGIHLSNAKWLLFLNAGDCLYKKDFLKILTLLERTESDFILFKQIDRDGNYSNYYNRRFSMPTSHQGQLYKKSIIENYLFNLNYVVGADFDLYKKLIIVDNITTYHSDLAITYESPPGFSKANENILKIDYYFIIKKYDGAFFAFCYKLLIGEAISDGFKNLVPKRIRSILRNLFRL